MTTFNQTKHRKSNSTFGKTSYSRTGVNELFKNLYTSKVGIFLERVSDKNKSIKSLNSTLFPTIPKINIKSPAVSTTNYFGVTDKVPIVDNFCKHCPHCIQQDDKYFEDHLRKLSKSKDIINSITTSILNSDVFQKGSNSFFVNQTVSEFESTMTSLVKYKTSEPVLDTLLNKFVDKALSDPSFFSEILNVENTKKFKDILFAQGQSFLDENDKLTFDEELKTFIDGNSHVLIKELIG